MASTKAVSATMANPSTIHRSSSPSSAPPRLLLAIPKALSVSTATRSLQRSLSVFTVFTVAHPSAASHTPTLATPTPSPLHRFLFDEPRKGVDILVEALEHEGITEVFAYLGGAFMESHQALTHSSSITNHLLCLEQCAVFAASSYTRSTSLPDVCIATSGPGTTNLVSSLADALLDSIPMVAITGQVPRRMIVIDAFQETLIVKVTRSITKHNYLVLDVDGIPHIIKEAFFLASCLSGPVLVDIPKDIQQQLSFLVWESLLPSPGNSPAFPSPSPTLA